MMMTVKETPKETRVSIYNERSAKSTGRIKGKQPGERSPQSISRTKSKVRDIVECNEFDFVVTLEIQIRMLRQMKSTAKSRSMGNLSVIFSAV